MIADLHNKPYDPPREFKDVVFGADFEVSHGEPFAHTVDRIYRQIRWEHSNTAPYHYNCGIWLDGHKKQKEQKDMVEKLSFESVELAVIGKRDVKRFRSEIMDILGIEIEEDDKAPFGFVASYPGKFGSWELQLADVSSEIRRLIQEEGNLKAISFAIKTGLLVKATVVPYNCKGNGGPL